MEVQKKKWELKQIWSGESCIKFVNIFQFIHFIHLFILYFITFYSSIRTNSSQSVDKRKEGLAGMLFFFAFQLYKNNLNNNWWLFGAPHKWFLVCTGKLDYSDGILFLTHLYTLPQLHLIFHASWLSKFFIISYLLCQSKKLWDSLISKIILWDLTII